MRKPSSRTQPTTTQARPGVGDVALCPEAQQVIAIIRALRAEGVTPAVVEWAGLVVELESTPMATGNPVYVPSLMQSIVREYGGAEIERLLTQSDGVPDLVDDEEQPALRGPS